MHSMPTISAATIPSFLSKDVQVAMLIRAATIADIPVMHELDLASPFGARWSAAHYQGFFATADSQKHLVLVAEESDAVVAYLAASGVGAEWELENIIVSGTRIRLGIARALLEELLERLKREDVHRLHLEVRDSNHPARALYAGLGFREVSRRKAYYTNPIEDAIIVWRAL